MAGATADRTLGRYRLLRRIAVGGMAEVFEARAVSPGADDTPLVLKVLLPQHTADPELVQMFSDEARLTRGLQHPNLVRVFDFGREAGEHFIVMEQIDGPSLAQLLAQLAHARRQLPVELGLYVGARLLEALRYIHDRTDDAGRSLEIVHRDVTPGNVLLTRGGDVKLGDFGIARSRLRSGRTRTGVIKGTVQYMAPEQIADGTLDRRTDLYGVGLILFELLTGHPFVEGEREVELLRIAQDPPWRAPSALRPDALDARVDRLLRPALARFPEERYPEARVFLAALHQLDPGLAEEQGLARRRAALGELARDVEPLVPSAHETPASAVDDAPRRTLRTEVPSPAPQRPAVKRWRALTRALLVAVALGGGLALYLALRPQTRDTVDAPAGDVARARPDGPRRDTAIALTARRDVVTADARRPDARPRRPRVGRPARSDAAPRAMRPAHAPDARVDETAPLRQRHAAALAALRAKGLLEEDLPAPTRARAAVIPQQLQRGAPGRASARMALEELERSVASLKVDRPLVETRLKRVDAQLRAASPQRADLQALRDRASVALQEVMEGRLAAANRILTEILLALRKR